jgi:cytoskeleton protein RodZ
MDEKGHDITTKDMGVDPEPEATPGGSEKTTSDLREIRKSKGLTLRDVSTSTRISPQNLKAIEEQRFDLLPEPIYARAFIDMYARTLDIDGKKILALYDDYLKGLEPDEYRYEVLKRLTAKRRHLEIRIWVVIVSVLLILVGAFYLYQWTSGDRQISQEVNRVGQIEDAGETEAVSEEIAPPEGGDITDSTIEEKEEYSEVESAPPADLPVMENTQETNQAIAEDNRSAGETDQPSVEGEQPVIETQQPEEPAGPDMTVPAAEKPYTLVIEASELTWIEIERDGNPPFEIMMRPGERFAERASEEFNLIIGNAGGVEIRFQGQSLGPLGVHGQVVHLTLPGDE